MLSRIGEDLGGTPSEVGDEGRGFNLGVVSLCKICANRRSSDLVVDLTKGPTSFFLLRSKVIKCSVAALK